MIKISFSSVVWLCVCIEFGPVMLWHRIVEKPWHDSTSPRTINIFAINFLILSIWSANSVFYDIFARLLDSRHCLCILSKWECHAVVQISVVFWLYLLYSCRFFMRFFCTFFFVTVVCVSNFRRFFFCFLRGTFDNNKKKSRRYNVLAKHYILAAINSKRYNTLITSNCGTNIFFWSFCRRIRHSLDLDKKKENRHRWLSKSMK